MGKLKQEGVGRWMCRVGGPGDGIVRTCCALVGATVLAGLWGCSTSTSGAVPVQWVVQARPAEVLEPGFEDAILQPRIECVVKPGGLRVEFWEPRLTALTVNRSASAGYCDVVVALNLTDRNDNTRTHQVMRRTVWFEIGEEQRLSFSLPSRFEIRNARAHTE